MFTSLGSLASRHWGAVILAWGVIAVGLHLVAPRWDDVTHDGDLAYLPDAMPSVQGERMLARAFPENRAKSQLAIIAERDDGRLTRDDLQSVDALTARFEAIRDELPIRDIWTRDTDVVGDKLISPAGDHGQATVILLQLGNEFMATDNIRVLAQVREVIAAARTAGDVPKGLRLGVSGSAAIGGDMLTSAAESIKNTELATVTLVIVILLMVYRAPAMVLIPLVTIGVSLVVAIRCLSLLTQLDHVPGFEWWNFKVFTTTKIFIVVILFGSGTDFCLFLIARYKEELQHGLSSTAAVAKSVSLVGEALVGSAMTTILGLGMMFFADFGKFRNSGPAIALCLAVTLAACLTLAPALLAALGGAVFWPFRMPVEPPAPSYFSGFWDRVSKAIVARPGLIMCGCLLLFAPFAYHGLSTPVTYDFLHELEPGRPSVVGTDMAGRHFPPGETSPVTILAYQPGAGFDQPPGEVRIAQLTKILYDVEGVNRVRSIAEPMGDPPGFFQLFSSAGRKKLAARKHPRAKATYFSREPELVGDVTRFDLVLDYDPFSPEATETLDRVDDQLRLLGDDPKSPWNQTQFSMVGATVGIRDLKVVTESDQILIQQLVVLGVLAVLMVILRRPLVSIYLILSVLLSYYVTIGATELFFRWSYGDTFQGLDWKAPIFLFVILIAVGEDYNIYLVTRVFEEQAREGSMRGLRLAVARTGGIITSCGVIMAGTFISMMTGTLRGMRELGFALALGVMIDTCLVRPILVPAFLALVERMKAGLKSRAAKPLVVAEGGSLAGNR